MRLKPVMFIERNRDKNNKFFRRTLIGKREGKLKYIHIALIMGCY